MITLFFRSNNSASAINHLKDLEDKEYTIVLKDSKGKDHEFTRKGITGKDGLMIFVTEYAKHEKDLMQERAKVFQKEDKLKKDFIKTKTVDEPLKPGEKSDGIIDFSEDESKAEVKKSPKIEGEKETVDVPMSFLEMFESEEFGKTASKSDMTFMEMFESDMFEEDREANKGLMEMLASLSEELIEKTAGTGEPKEDAPDATDLVVSKNKLLNPVFPLKDVKTMYAVLGKKVEDAKGEALLDDIMSGVDDGEDEDLIQQRVKSYAKRLSKLKSVKEIKKILDKKFRIGKPDLGLELTLDEIPEVLERLWDLFLKELNKNVLRLNQQKEKAADFNYLKRETARYIDPET